MRRTQWIALLTALCLALCLLAGCGGSTPSPAPAPNQQASPAPADTPAPQEPVSPPAQDTTPAPPPALQETAPSQEETPEPPSAQQPAAPDSQPEVPAPEAPPAAPTEPAPGAAAEPEPEPAPAPEPEPEGESVRAGDTYTISVTLEGGSGRASVDSPAKLRYDKTGKCWATIVWSSPNFDYMKVDGQRYDPINTEGNSTFEILVSAFDTPLPVIADTVAMSEPHEVEYTLTFDYASMEDA